MCHSVQVSKVLRQHEKKISYFTYFSFEATNADTIKRIAKEPISKSVYVIMAQALDERVPPFVLQINGTNGSFTACDVIRRWHYTKLELEKYVILSILFLYVNLVL